jgi:hypothetical protein
MISSFLDLVLSRGLVLSSLLDLALSSFLDMGSFLAPVLSSLLNLVMSSFLEDLAMVLSSLADLTLHGCRTIFSKVKVV